MQRSARMKREIQILQQNPPFGISCWQKGDSLEFFDAQIVGGEGTPFEGGVFKLEVQIPERYPFEPPKMKFITPIYHPNIDNAGRICLDSLKMPPKGAWRPALNISTVLTSIQLLMAEANPEDPLMTEIANEYKHSRSVYLEKAKVWTKQHAMKSQSASEEKENPPQTSKILAQKRTSDESQPFDENKKRPK